MASETYCPTCGYPNETARGACLICYDMVKGRAGGSACPSCAGQNPKEALFCMGCQAALGDGAMPLMKPDISGLVSGMGAAVGGAGVMADAGDYADDLGFGVPEAGDSEMNFDLGASDTGDDEYADDVAPPPPPPDSAAVGDMMDTDFAMDTDKGFTAPPPPDTAFDLGEEDAVPLPPDSVSLDMDDVSAPADAAPADAAPADEDDLGDWSLDFDE